MAYAQKVSAKAFNRELIKNKAYRMQLARLMLEEKAYTMYGCKYDELSNKEQEKVAIKTAEEWKY